MDPLSHSAARRTNRILVVEDEPADVMLIQLAFQQCGFPVRLEFAPNGEEALSTLSSASGQHDLVLLDINLPRMNGKEMLRELRLVDELKGVPVAVFTSSTNATDVSDCYRLGANCYVEKPTSFEALLNVVRQLSAFWMQTALLPTHDLEHVSRP